jgi:hypothetical protein
MDSNVMRLSYATAKGVLNRLSEGLCADLNALNIPKEAFDLVKGDIQWIATDRPVVVNVINSLIFGSLDLAGLPRFPLPVEYVAAVIVSVVHPTNRMIACSWMESYTHSAQDMAQVSNPDNIVHEPITASQCQALVYELSKEDVSDIIPRFEKRCNIKLDKQRLTAVDG